MANMGYLWAINGRAPVASPLTGVAPVLGDFVDIMFNGGVWYVSGICSGTNASTGGNTSVPEKPAIQLYGIKIKILKYLNFLYQI